MCLETRARFVCRCLCAYRFALGVLLLVPPAITAAACTTFRVLQDRPQPTSGELFTAHTGGIDVRAEPIVGRDSYWKLFDDDLPQIGMAAVWVAIHNGSHQEIAVDPHQWLLRTGRRRQRALRVDQVLERYYKGRHVRMYSVAADKGARQELEKISLPQGLVRPGAAVEGFLFFPIDHSLAPHWNRDATLTARGVFAGDKRKTVVALPLYANR